jgi:hypothetical protein
MRIGGDGVVSMVNRVNKEGWPVPGKSNSWHTALLGRVLHSRALLGEYVQVHLRGGEAPVTHPLHVEGLGISGIDFTTAPGKLPVMDD